MANKLRVGSVRIYSRHSQDCKHKKDAAHIDCRCPKWVQYQLDKKQIRKSTGVCTFSEAKKFAQNMDWGKAPEECNEESPGKTVEFAVKDWLAFREVNGLGSDKPKLLGRRLVEWCDENGVVYLNELTSHKVVQFRTSLPYKTKTSSSLKVHWSIMAGFFGWAHGIGLLTENPVPNTKVYPQFRIKFQKPEVVPPTKDEVEKVLATATGLDRLFALVMRHTGMSIRDTTLLSRTKLTGNLIWGNRSKTKEQYRVRIPAWLADSLAALPGNNFFLIDGVTTRRMVQRWEKSLRRVFKTATVKMSPHKFRHFFISEQLAAGTPEEAVALMVGTSPQEIRKTYQHWIKEAEDRLDALQAEVWKKQGLDSAGNPIAPTVQ